MKLYHKKALSIATIWVIVAILFMSAGSSTLEDETEETGTRIGAGIFAIFVWFLMVIGLFVWIVVFILELNSQFWDLVRRKKAPM